MAKKEIIWRHDIMDSLSGYVNNKLYFGIEPNMITETYPLKYNLRHGGYLLNVESIELAKEYCEKRFLPKIITEEEIIIKNNILIAEFMGYIYFEPNVLVDYSDIGGIYDEVNVYSKVPIQVNDYGEGEKYFAKLPNPDFGNENSKRWSSEIEKLDWNTLNSEHYITDLSYNSSWNELIPVVEKIETMDYGFKMCRKVVEVYIDSTKEEIIRNKDKNRMESLYKSVVEFVKYYNEKNENKK